MGKPLSPRLACPVHHHQSGRRAGEMRYCGQEFKLKLPLHRPWNIWPAQNLNNSAAHHPNPTQESSTSHSTLGLDSCSSLLAAMWKPPITYLTLHCKQPDRTSCPLLPSALPYGTDIRTDAWIIFAGLLALVVIYPYGNVPAIDAWYFGASASTESGLGTCVAHFSLPALALQPANAAAVSM